MRQNDNNPERVFLDDAVLAGSTPSGVNVADHFSVSAVADRYLQLFESVR